MANLAVTVNLIEVVIPPVETANPNAATVKLVVLNPPVRTMSLQIAAREARALVQPRKPVRMVTTQSICHTRDAALGH